MDNKLRIKVKPEDGKYLEIGVTIKTRDLKQEGAASAFYSENLLKAIEKEMLRLAPICTKTTLVQDSELISTEPTESSELRLYWKIYLKVAKITD